MPSLQLRDVAQAILRRFRVILLVVLVFVGATLVSTLLQPTVYEASAKVVVGQKSGVPQDSDLVKPPAPTAEGLQEPAQSVVEAIDSRPVAEEVIQRLGLRMEHSELVENLSVEPEWSSFLQLSYKNADPERAQQIVNTVGVVSSERIPEAIGRANDVVVTMYEDASVPGSPVSPDPVRDGLLALLLGLMIGLGVVLLAEYMDERPSRS